jgi:predicted membrane-bound dolichyl-phosphate-mannose-protein mannosyltransferase
MKSRIITLILTLLLIFLILYRFGSSQGSYRSDFDYGAVSDLYQHSQFAQDPQDRWFIIQDWELYPYAGISYLRTGDLSQINVEHPPLGKYLYGLVYLLTSKPVLLQISLYLLLLLVSFLIARQILHNSNFALLVPLGIASEELIAQQLYMPLLENLQTVAVLMFVYVCIRNLRSLDYRKVQLTLGIILGTCAGIKYPAATVLLFAAYTATLYLLDPKTVVKRVWLPAFTALILYLSLYLPLFYQHGLGGFIDVHMKAARIHLSHVPNYPLLAPARTMLLNQWPVWFDAQNPVRQVDQWQLSWPVLFLLSCASFILIILKKKTPQDVKMVFPLGFLFLYLIFINTRLFFPGYLITALPFMYLSSLWLIGKLYPRNLFPGKFLGE